LEATEHQCLQKFIIEILVSMKEQIDPDTMIVGNSTPHSHQQTEHAEKN
jgi:hypothetical protein